MALGRTIFGSFPAPFTPAPTCSTLGLRAQTTGSAQFQAAHYGASCSMLNTRAEIYIADNCYPPGFVSNWIGLDGSSADAHFSTIAFWSPALSCPIGWTTACTVERSQGVAAPSPSPGNIDTAASVVWNVLTDGETAVRCCPSGYGCDNNEWVQCAITATLGETISGTSILHEADDSPMPNCSPIQTSFTITEDSDYPGSKTLSIALGNGYAVWLLQGQAVMTGGSRASSRAASTPTTSTSTSGGEAKSTSSGGLTSGAKIAIGIIIPLFVIGGAAVAFLFWRRRRKSNNVSEKVTVVENSLGKPELQGSEGQHAAGLRTDQYAKPELGAMQQPTRPMPEAMGHERHELSGNQAPSANITSVAELSDMTHIYELDGDRGPTKQSSEATTRT